MNGERNCVTGVADGGVGIYGMLGMRMRGLKSRGVGCGSNV